MEARLTYGTWNFPLFLCIFLKFVFCVWVFLHVPQAYRDCGGLKRILDLLELELQMAENLVLCKNSQCSLILSHLSSTSYFLGQSFSWTQQGYSEGLRIHLFYAKCLPPVLGYSCSSPQSAFGFSCILYLLYVHWCSVLWKLESQTSVSCHVDARK